MYVIRNQAVERVNFIHAYYILSRHDVQKSNTHAKVIPKNHILRALSTTMTLNRAAQLHCRKALNALNATSNKIYISFLPGEGRGYSYESSFARGMGIIIIIAIIFGSIISCHCQKRKKRKSNREKEDFFLLILFQGRKLNGNCSSFLSKPLSSK